MPRQKGSVPLIVRVRENQRRSRARQKELIEDMRTKIQDYEQRGVQASLELQQAARRVAWENEKLRSLIASRGIARQEIEDYLEHLGHGGRGVMSTNPVQNGRHTAFDGMVGSPSTELCSSPRQPSSKSNAQQDVILMGIESGLKDTLPSAEMHTSTDLVPFTGQSISHPHALSTDDVDLSNAPYETSCEVAANIIASMRWHGEQEERFDNESPHQRKILERKGKWIFLLNMK